MLLIRCPWLAASVFLGATRLGLAAVPDRVDFNFHVRPLLSDRCFACHGPDERARKGGLGLHTVAGVRAGGKSGSPTLKAGDPDGSELFRRLATSDPDDAMPPRDSKIPALSPDELETVRRWIRQGADYKEHWAFLPAVRPAIPVDETRGPSGSSSNPVDAFVKARLATEGLSIQPEATRETLIRRVHLDLTGLPPTPAQIDAFLADPAPDAYEKLVDRVLRSPHYGERMAQEWMDLARYADTYGYQADVDRDMSAWRDWVIRSLNDNLPWDQFITWQLAGDLLENPGRDQILATAFNRLHRQTNEGGSIEEEFRNEYVSDRVHTMGTAFLGLTLECARCHEHKYDPIGMRDYYGLAGFFNSIDESGLYSHFTRATPTPVMLLWEKDGETRHRDITARLDRQETELREMRLDAFERLPGPGRLRLPSHPVLPSVPRPVVHLSFEHIITNKTPDTLSTNWAQLSDGPVLSKGASGMALQFSGDNAATISHAPRFGRSDPFSMGLWLEPTLKQDRAVVFHSSVAWTDSGSRGYELVLDDGKPFFALIHFWPGNAVAVRARDPIPLGVWTHLTVTYDGSSRAAGIRLYRDGEPLDVEVVRDNLYKDFRHLAVWGDSDSAGVPIRLAGRFRDSGFKHGLIDEFQVFDIELTALEAVALSRSTAAGRDLPLPPSLSKKGAEWAALHDLARNDAAYAEALRTARDLRREEDALVTPVREIMVMKELPERRQTYVLRRGAYDSPTDPVDPGVPERIAPMRPEWPKNRLGLASWITSPENPLTARVAVNRVWRLHFGRGLVATTWDFGAQGQLPSHPELLDWLATRFIDTGWDRKALHRLLLLSETYRQSSLAPAESIARDPENRLLGRGSRHRLDAEQIRDSALAASGLLVPKIGGPSVKPYQPPGVWEDAGTGKSYTPDKGDNLYRRSLYTFWRRTAPPPNMLTFDATSREVCTAKREVTTTPLQALVLLNDPQFLEASRVLAERLVEAFPDSLHARVREAYLRLVGRMPGAGERAVIDRLVREQHAYFEAHPEEATRFVSVGQKPRNEALRAVDVATTTVLASTLMNHDEFVMIR